MTELKTIEELHPTVIGIDRAIKLIRRTVRRVDPGHIQMAKYLERTANKLEKIAVELQERIDRESGA